eukprot:3719487-Pyramimonas_sp.AAC.1
MSSRGPLEPFVERSWALVGSFWSLCGSLLSRLWATLGPLLGLRGPSGTTRREGKHCPCPVVWGPFWHLEE